MIDVLVVGAGPAGSVAALVLARAGVRVLMLERDTLPRPKLCGDTLNPGAVGLLGNLGLSGGPLDIAERMTGMLVTTPDIAVRGAYPEGQVALAVPRVHFDQWLAQAAVAAGAHLECGVRVLGPVWRTEPGRPGVMAGVAVRRDNGQTIRMPAMLTIAADGRRSALARAANLSRHPARPRRWAFGGYATDVDGMSSMGEMHVRPGHYVGLAPIGAGITNICIVTGRKPVGRTPEDVIRRVLASDPRLRERTHAWRPIGPPHVLGPLAVDCDVAGMPGLLLAGDAAGFVDPMTGDGMHIAMRGGMLAAAAALEALASGDMTLAAGKLTAARASTLGSKLRFNRWMRRLVGSRAAINVVGAGARMAPSMVTRLVWYAGDAA
ncbi:MAG: NAD(P)/FAD-dependent oxidoreductase [Acidobacteria bacterium]|nr:NAD(P)/FAD-dependent oxidoreductase [Acidobacteriota bacterium]